MSQHVYPVASEHVTAGLMCWCVPRFYVPCDECTDGCWQCVEGLIELTVAEAEQCERQIIIVHNR